MSSKRRVVVDKAPGLGPGLQPGMASLREPLFSHKREARGVFPTLDPDPETHRQKPVSTDPTRSQHPRRGGNQPHPLQTPSHRLIPLPICFLPGAW